MIKKMLDTNICIYIIKNKPQSVMSKFLEFNAGELSLSVITVSELFYGAYKSQYIDRNLNAITKFLLPFEIIEFDYKASVEYGKIRAKLEKKGQIIGNMDMQIAAQALSMNLDLVSNNLKEFKKVEGLKVENWV